MPEQYAAEQAALTGRSPRRVLRARGMSASHTSEFCPELQRADRNRPDWCSSRATHAGSCRQFHRCRDADKKRRGRRGRGGVRRESRETRLRRGRIQRRGGEGKRREKHSRARRRRGGRGGGGPPPPPPPLVRGCEEFFFVLGSIE